MIAPEQLADFLDEAVDDDQFRTELEEAFLEEREALRYVHEQREMDRVLRSLLHAPARHERIKSSILSAVNGLSVADLQDRVLKETSRSTAVEHPFRGFKAMAATLLRLLVPALALGLLFVWWLFGRPVAPAAIGRVVAAVGTPLVRASRANIPAELAVAQFIRFGDRIETGDADRAEVQFNDGTTLQLHFNTVLEIPLPKQFTAASRPPLVNLLRGQVWTKVQKSTNGETYSIKTDLATALARGTEFGINLRRASAAGTNGTPGLEAVLTVKEGTVDFTNSLGSVRATAMHESVARTGFAPTEPKRLAALRTVQSSPGNFWVTTTEPLAWSSAAEKLAEGGGAVGFEVADLPGDANGVRVTQLEPNSANPLSSLQPGDQIVALNGQTISNRLQFEKRVLFSPHQVLQATIYRDGRQEVIPLTVTHRLSAIRAPGSSMIDTNHARSLVQSEAESAHDALQIRDLEKRRQALASQLMIKSARAAAFNDFGVLFELEDAVGAAVRAYGKAAYLEPDVALYRYNLALALRKIASFERAQEEFEAAARLAPQNETIRLRLAEVTALAGNPGEALDLTDRELKGQPADHGFWELKAQLLLSQKRLEEARVAALEAISLRPDCPVAHGYLAGIYHDQRRFQEADAEYVKAIQLAPLNGLLHMNRGLLQLDLEQFSEAEWSLRQAVALRPDLPLVWKNLGKLFVQQDARSNALQAFQKARELDPEDPEARRESAALFLKMRRFADAERERMELLAQAPDEPESHFDLGEVYREQNKLAEAEKMHRRAIELNPRYAPSQTALGLIADAQGEYDRAEAFYRKAVELDPKESAALHNLGEIYRTVRGDLDQAETFYRRALTAAPKSPETHRGLAQVMVSRNDPVQAEKLFKRAVDLAPSGASFRVALADFYRSQGDFGKAEEIYRQAISLEPDFSGARLNLAITLAENGDHAGAEKLLREEIRLVGDQPPLPVRLPALVNLAREVAELGRTDEALGIYREAYKIAPDEPRVCNAFAWFLATHKLRLDEALALARHAVDKVPTDPDFLDTLGWTLFQRNDFAAAEVILKKALQFAGDKSSAPAIREHLEKTQQAAKN